ncbi:HlyD family type I secretion periplasmic adaptor subunit [Palleronia abyssalis]|nr:HlyD family type I secretion periplasmic adaptor subunit [Palleronia abyssalis]
MRQTANWPARGPVMLGLAALVLLLAGFGYWASFSTLSGAIVVQGRIEVERNRQIVQHVDGGMVSELLVDEGDHVEKGQTLAILDAALLDTQLAAARIELAEYQARRARLEAERDDAAEVTFDADLAAAAADNDDVADIVEGQADLFQARRDTAKSNLNQLSGRRAQIVQQIGGLDAQLASLDVQVGIMTEELEDQQSLFDRGLAQASRVLALRREAAQLEGRIGELVASRAEAGERLSEIADQEMVYTVQRREDAISELRDIRMRESETTERVAALAAQRARTDIVAPVRGIVHDLTVFGPTAVVRPAEPMMSIVPTDRPPVIEARVPPVHIDQVGTGQPAILRFPTFDARTTPELHGTVLRVSADSFTDEATQATFYKADLMLDLGQIERLPDGLVLLPGMPVEGYLRTSDRTPIAYLTKPLTDYFARAFREG